MQINISWFSVNWWPIKSITWVKAKSQVKTFETLLLQNILMTLVQPLTGPVSTVGAERTSLHHKTSHDQVLLTRCFFLYWGVKTIKRKVVQSQGPLVESYHKHLELAGTTVSKETSVMRSTTVASMHAPNKYFSFLIAVFPHLYLMINSVCDASRVYL